MTESGGDRAAEVTFRTASREDDEALRALLRRSPSGGDVRLRIEKEPDFFAAFQVEGERGDVLLGRSGERHIVAVGARSEKACYVNGRARTLGYLSNLRIDPAFRGGGLLEAGYAEMKRLHREGETILYLTTIMADNEPAIRALTGGRPGLPRYRDIGRYDTFVLSARTRFGAGSRSVQVRRAEASDLPALEAFWEKEGSRRQFFPAYTAEHVANRKGLLRGLLVSNIAVAVDESGIVGTAALWDQTAFRQWVIDSYSPRLTWLRPFYNAWAMLTRRPRLPAPGRALAYRFLSLVCVRNDDPRIFRSLLESLGSAVPRDSLVVAGMHERDPLRAVLAPRPHVRFASRLFVVHWEDGDEAFGRLDKRVPYVEVGGL